ncbi:MAG: hypothetical protein KDD54_03675, partial [Flavobacteriales bacterium]|nr:hypothetical protein [Flavobacteriales bacterium]
DTKGFAKFLGITQKKMPKTKIVDRRNPANIELDFPYKPSLYMMRQLVVHSNKTSIREQLTPVDGAKKGPQYNSALIPYIWNQWDIETALQKSYSLRIAIERLREFVRHVN